MRSTNQILFLTSLLAITSIASAQVGGFDPAELFAQADTNHDGVISRQEFLAARAARFEQLDRDRDGFLDDTDIPRFMRKNPQRMEKFQAMLQLADSNHDGKVSRDEFVAVGQRLFDLIDSNHDNVIDKAELQQASERLRALAAGKGAL